MEVMTLKDYRTHINDSSLDVFEHLPVVASSDDEGNGFDRVLFQPTMLENIEVSNDNKVFKKVICIN